MIGALISVIRLLVILSYVGVISLAIATLMLSLSSGEAFTPFLPSLTIYMIDGLPIWLLSLIILLFYCFGIIMLTFVLAPAILLLGIYDAIERQTNMLKEQETILLKRQSKINQRQPKTEPSAF